METQQNQNQSANQPGSTQSTSGLNQLESFFDTYLHKKAPFHLPPSAKEWIVKYGPWITLIVMLLALPVILAALGLTAFFSPFAMMSGRTGFGGMYLLSGLISLASFVLEAVALPGLFGRKLSGWHLIYYSSLLSTIGGIIGGNIVGALIGLIISMFFLFEIREYYK